MAPPSNIFGDVLEILQAEFGLQPIGAPTADLEAMLGASVAQ